MKCISIFGSTGSIGRQTLEVVDELRRNGERIEVVALSCKSNLELLAEQAERYGPRYVGVVDPSRKRS